MANDSEINEAVERKLGWEKTEDGQWSRPDPFGGRVLKWRHFDYCHKIEAAQEIVEHLTSEGKISELWISKDSSTFHIHQKATEEIIANADTAPMAICLAFLKLP